MKKFFFAASAALVSMISTAADHAYVVDGETHIPEAITEVGDTTVSANGEGTLYLDGTVAAGGTLTFQTVTEEEPWGSSGGTAYIRESDVLVLPGKSIDNYEVAGGHMAGLSITAGPASAHRVVRGSGTLTLNMCRQDSVNVKMRKLQFTDTVDGIVVKSLYKSYKTTTDLNTDFDTDAEAVSHRTAASSDGYEVNMITFRMRCDQTWIKAATNVTAHALALGAGTRLAFYEGGALGTGGVFSGTLSGSGATLEFGPNTSAGGAPSTFASLNGVTDNSNPRVAALVARNTGIASVTGVSNPEQYSADIALTAGVYFFENDGVTAECQIQGYDTGSLCKVAFLTLFQKGADVYGVINTCMYAAKATYPQGTDYRTLEGAAGVTTVAQNYYPVRRFDLTAAATPTKSFTLNGVNSMTEATWAIRTNATVIAGVAKALPVNGVVSIYAGGSLHMQAQPDISAGVYVYPGGVLAQSCLDGLNRTGMDITVDGGILALSPVSYSSMANADDCGTYVRNVTFMNGAKVTGLPPRVGLVNTTWTVSGSSPSYYNAGLKLVNNASYAFTLDVRDATGDSGTDFYIAGKMYDMGTLTGLKLVKTGAGTVRFGGASTCLSPVEISAGTLILGVTNAVNPSQAVTLSGGTLAVEAGAGIAASALKVTANSSILIGGGATLTFADSSAVAWGDGVTLAFPDELPKKTVRFGTSAAGLTAAQLKCVRLNGKMAVLDAEGYLSRPPPGFILSVN